MMKLLKIAVILVFMVSLAPSIQAAGSQPTTNAEVQKVIREVAAAKGIPAEILKAIATIETDMKQFKSDGTPNVSADGGIGIMQLTLSATEISQYQIDVEKLKSDTRYNIEQGANLLIRKWDNPNLPQVNQHEKNKIEDWYFAIMAYNGLSKRNDPNVSGSKAYQEEVLQTIRNNSLLPIGQTPKLDIRYPNATTPDLMVFPAGVDYEWPTSTKTTQNYQVNDIAYTFNTDRDNSNFRTSLTGSVSSTILHYTPVRIVSGPIDSMTNLNNHYIFYKVKGTDFEGYIASSNLITSKDVTFFQDVHNKETLRAVTFLQSRKTINGFADGTYRPDLNLKRYEAAKLIVQSLGLTLPSGYKMKATDMKPGSPGYEYMIIVEAHGIMGAGGKLKPYQYLTRSEMASILVRSFDKVYATPPAGYRFAGVSATDPNVKNISKLAFNKITVNNPFNGNGTVTRGQYAVFLERSVKLKEAQN
jgi:hypothetical protein